MTDTGRAELLLELNRAARRLGAKSELIAVIGAWGNPLTDADVLRNLRCWNEAMQPGIQRQEGIGMEAAIQNEIYQAFYALNAPPELLGPIGSWGDTYSEEEVLADVRRFNRVGTIFDVDEAENG